MLSPGQLPEWSSIIKMHILIVIYVPPSLDAGQINLWPFDFKKVRSPLFWCEDDERGNRSRLFKLGDFEKWVYSKQTHNVLQVRTRDVCEIAEVTL